MLCLVCVVDERIGFRARRDCTCQLPTCTYVLIYLPTGEGSDGGLDERHSFLILESGSVFAGVFFCAFIHFKEIPGTSVLVYQVDTQVLNLQSSPELVFTLPR